MARAEMSSHPAEALWLGSLAQAGFGVEGPWTTWQLLWFPRASHSWLRCERWQSKKLDIQR